MEEQRRSAVQTRSGYKSKATRVKKIIEKYETDSTLLTLGTALAEIEHNLNLLPELRQNFEKIQETIIQLTEDSDEREAEVTNLATMLDSFDDSEAKLVKLRGMAQSVKGKDDNIRGMFEFINARLDEQQIQQEVERRLAEARYKEDREAELNKFEATLNLLISENNSITASTPKTKNAEISSNAKLQELSIPDFDGKYADWTSFRDLFLAIIDKNESLNDINKFYYLHSALKGEAKSVIDHLAVTSNNYKIAWDLLLETYDNVLVIAMSHIRAFMNTPKMTEPSAEVMRRTFRTVTSSIQALDAMGVEERDIWLIFLILEKLDSETKVLWSRVVYNKIPTWNEFVSFLSKRYKSMEAVSTSKSEKPAKRTEMKSKPPNKAAPNWSANLAAATSSNQGNIVTNVNPTTTTQCACCGKTNHRTVKCYKFRGLNDSKRFEIARAAKLCTNCLDPGHSVENCQSSLCKHCAGKHSTWLHFAFHPEQQPNQVAASANVASVGTNAVTTTTGIQVTPVPGTSSSLSCTAPAFVPNVLLATAVIYIQTAEGDKIPCRAILDSGSQANIITEKMCQLLKLPKRKSNCRLQGVGAQTSPSRFQVTVNFSPRGYNKWTQTDCFVQTNITGLHPAVDIPNGSLPIPLKFVMADPQWYRPQPIDILIGGQHYWDLVLDRTIRMGPGLPILKQSVFGWLIVGEIGPIPAVQESTQSCCMTTLESIDNTLKRFWEIEDAAGPVERKDEDEQAEKIYQETVTRDETGRFIVHLPFTEKVQHLASNKPNAARQLYFLERKLRTTPDLRAKYEGVFAEYLSLSIIEKVPRDEIDRKAYYLPYHGVYKESSTTTKLRVVFNASSKSKTSLSLNDTLLTGPLTQPPLIETLWRFRQHQWALTCDITKMYLQFLVTPEQRDYHRFLWRTHKSGEVEEYRFRTLCFGVASSPYLATRSLMQLASEDGDKFPAAREAIRSSFYVDDCLVSANSIEELQQIKGELIELLSGAGLQLSKWTSNVPSLCGSEYTKDVTANVADSEPVKTLGLLWSPQSDKFSYKLAENINCNHPTKRQVLSLIARTFDPLGFIGPVMVNAKCLMQSLWQLKCDWDQEVPETVLSEWKSFLKSLSFIPNIKIPRCISEFTQVSKIEVHLFTDASKKAYGAAIYIVTEDSSGIRASRLLTAKCRVAPVKVATIPKLELCAAALGSRILKAVCDSLKCHNHYCWTDAMIVLCQIRSPVKREAFVKKRLEDILKNTRGERWYHVPTTHNPADLISRGVTAEQLDESSLWWNGPDWLSKPTEYWPTEPESPQEGCFLATTTQWLDIREYLYQKSNSFSRIRRVMAWVLRFLSKIIGRGTQQSGPLHPEEIQRAEVVLVRLEQQELLVDDVKALSSAKKTPVSKQLRHLQVFLDDDKVMRVKGRLENADVDENTKQPMILPSGPLAKMILHHEHHRLLHAGPTLIMTEIRRKFWPTFGRRLPRDVYWKCITCNRAKPRPCKQLMGQLPSPRVTLTRPFASTGVDFAGPVLVKASKLRKAPILKTYLAVFICMAVKAVHIEVVSDLTTEAFLASVRRFSARRGTPTDVYSDNGTNFVGAAHQLGKFLASPDTQNALIDATSGSSITWHFIPPRSPHWGGLWEAAVKTLKYHLNRVMGTTVLTYEELTTVTTQIEGVMNSRPLTALPDTEADPDVLTPAHLLMTKPITNLPDWDLETVSRLDRWQLTQKLYQDISKRWKREYLVSLQHRSKWDKECSNLRPGDVVLVLDNTSAGASWPIARVMDTHPGRDGRVRLVTIKMKNSTYKRPIQVLAKLPTESEEHQEPSEVSK